METRPAIEAGSAGLQSAFAPCVRVNHGPGRFVLHAEQSPFRRERALLSALGRYTKTLAPSSHRELNPSSILGKDKCCRNTLAA
jgi:hypothetical protein